MKWMLNMMPLSRYMLSLQTGLHKQFILGTVILPTLDTGVPSQSEVDSIPFDPPQWQATQCCNTHSFLWWWPPQCSLWTGTMVEKGAVLVPTNLKLNSLPKGTRFYADLFWLEWQYQGSKPSDEAVNLCSKLFQLKGRPTHLNLSVNDLHAASLCNPTEYMPGCISKLYILISCWDAPQGHVHQAAQKEDWDHKWVVPPPTCRHALHTSSSNVHQISHSLISRLTHPVNPLSSASIYSYLGCG